MADGVSISLDQADIERFRTLLAGIGSNNSGFRLAARRAIGKTQTGVRTLIAKEIGQKVTLKSKFIKSRIKFSRPKVTRNNITSLIRISGAIVLSINYKHGKQTRRGVSIKIFKDSAATKARHAFIAAMPKKRKVYDSSGNFQVEITQGAGHIGIFRRDRSASKYDGRLPLVEYRGPRISTLFEETQGLRDRVLRTSAQRLLDQMESQTTHLLSQQ